MHVSFKRSDVPAAERPAVRAALLRIEAGDERGQWPEAVDRITVGKQLSGGGGARVLEVDLHRGTEILPRVLKVGPAHLMHEEWTAYRKHLVPRDTELIAGIEAATPGARDSARQRIGEDEAVVYRHVRHHAGEDHVRSLEDVAGEAITSNDAGAADRATALIGKLFDKAGAVFYQGARPDRAARPLSELNVTLGADLVVEIGEMRAGRAFLDDRPDRADQVCLPDVIADQARRLEPEWPPGRHIVVHGLTLVPGREPVTGDRDGVRVELRVRPGQEDRCDPAVLAGATFTVSGKIVGWRAESTRERARVALDGSAGAGLLNSMFDALPAALDDELPGRVRSFVHGDLHGANVLVAGDRPYLIDYARCHDNGLLLTDFVWLEINLLRRVVGAHLSFDGLLRLERLLAVATACFVRADELRRDAVVDRLARADTLEPAFRLLARLRWEAQRCCPAGSPVFWTEYQRHLLIAAHRTFKWPDEAHEPAYWRAATAAGVVAAEWLGDRPLLRWPDADLDATLAEVLEPVSGMPCARLVAIAAAEADHRPGDIPRLNDRIGAAAAALAREHPRRPATPLSDHDDAGVPLLNLAGRLPATGEPVPDAVAYLARHRYVLLTGPSGAGKSTALATLSTRMPAGQERMPVVVDADMLLRAALTEAVREVLDAPAIDLLTAGAVHVAIDGWDNLDTDGQRDAAVRVDALRSAYPRSPVVVAVRSADNVPLTGFVTLELAPPRLEQVVTYLVSAAANGRADTISVEQAAELVRELLGPQDTGVRELVRTPLYLALLGRRLSRSAIPATVADLLDDHFPDLKGAAELAAADLDGTPAPAGTHDVLVDAGLLRPDRRFAFPVYRDHFAARALASGLVPLAPRVASVRWQAALWQYVSTAGADEVIRLLGPADPVAVARLMAASRPQAQSLPAFVAETTARLRAVEAGPDQRDRAAEALALLGPPGQDALAAVAVDASAPEQARVAAFHRSRPRRAVSSALQDHRLPAAVRAAALRSACGVPALSVLVGSALTDDAPWPVADAAYSTLRNDRVQMTPGQRRAYTLAVERRLTEIEDEIALTKVAADFRVLQARRLELLDRLPRARRLPALLARRFAAGIDTDVADRLDDLLVEAPETADDTDEHLRLHRLLTGSPGDLLDLFHELQITSDPDPMILGAALRGIAGTPPSAWPGGVSAAAQVRDEGTGLAERLARHAIDSGLPLAGPAALLRAVTALDPIAGARLGYRLHKKLRERHDDARFQALWFTAVAQSQAAMPGWAALLEGPDDDRKLVIAALAASDFHRRAGAAPASSWITDEVRARLWSIRPPFGPTWDTVEFLRAAATAELTDALPAVLGLLSDPALAQLERTLPNGGTGRRRVTARTELLTVAGYLARRALGDASSAAADDVAAQLRSLAVGDHGGERGARAVALAYLGDWPELLGVLPAEPQLTGAARNAFRRWVPGPCTPQALRSHDRLATWIADRLNAPGTSALVRDALWEIQTGEAAKAGVLPVAGR